MYLILAPVSLSKQILLALVVRGNPRFASVRQHWILGQGTLQKKPRWSAGRDVLGWWKD